MASYDTLARVYDWLVPDALLEPQGSVAALEPVVGALPRGARVLDCAAGTGQLAVGLALRGFDVVAADASAEMVRRTRALAARHGARLAAIACAWEGLPALGGGFHAVFCVGNSLAHAEGRAARRAALAAMGGCLRDGGVLVLTSRNWELVRRAGTRLDVADRLVERGGRAGLVIYAWTIAESAGDPHHVDVAVALLGDAGAVATHGERLRFWPFTPEVNRCVLGP